MSKIVQFPVPYMTGIVKFMCSTWWNGVASGVLDSPLQAVHASVRIEEPARYGTAVEYRSLLSGKPEPGGMHMRALRNGR
jgi:hypothetical protein